MNKERIFMEIAESIAKFSTCYKKQVGTILLKETRIISTGYNGVPSKQLHCKDIFKKYYPADCSVSHREWSFFNELHAEENCIAFAAKNGVSTKDTTMYITLSPCINCAKLIVTAGIKKVIYKNYSERHSEAIKFLQKNNILIEQIK